MKIAVTGGIATGKSTVIDHLEQLGFRVASSDRVARELWSEPEVQQALVELLGGDPVEDLRAAVRLRASESAPFRRSLNRLLHPRIARRIDAMEAQFVEVPLLIEAVRHPSFDSVWVVSCHPDTQLQRLFARGLSPSEATRWLASQLPTEVKEAFADEIVRTDEPLPHVHALLENLVSKALK